MNWTRYFAGTSDRAFMSTQGWYCFRRERHLLKGELEYRCSVNLELVDCLCLFCYLTSNFFPKVDDAHSFR